MTVSETHFALILSLLSDAFTQSMGPANCLEICRRSTIIAENLFGLILSLCCCGPGICFEVDVQRWCLKPRFALILNLLWVFTQSLV